MNAESRNSLSDLYPNAFDIAHGEKKVFINGYWMRVKAVIEQLKSLSAHADRDQLIDYIRQSKDHLKKVFVNHGEEEVVLKFCKYIESELGVEAVNVNNNVKYKLE